MIISILVFWSSFLIYFSNSSSLLLVCPSRWGWSGLWKGHHPPICPLPNTPHDLSFFDIETENLNLVSFESCMVCLALLFSLISYCLVLCFCFSFPLSSITPPASLVFWMGYVSSCPRTFAPAVFSSFQLLNSSSFRSPSKQWFRRKCPLALDWVWQSLLWTFTTSFSSCLL